MSYRRLPATWPWMCGSPFNDLLLNRAKVRVRQDSVRVLDEELKNQQQSFNAGIVGNLNVQRAEVALANEQPELFNAQTQLKNSYLRLGDLFGTGCSAPEPRQRRLKFRENCNISRITPI